MSVVVEFKDVWRRIKAADMGTRTVALMVCAWLPALFFAYLISGGEPIHDEYVANLYREASKAHGSLTYYEAEHAFKAAKDMWRIKSGLVFSLAEFGPILVLGSLLVFSRRRP